MNKLKNYTYFKIKRLQCETKIEFDNLPEFIRFVELQQFKSLFIVQNGINNSGQFASTYQGVLLLQDRMGFETLEDFQHAVSQGFSDAITYYDAKALGYTSFHEYALMKESGIDNKETYDKIKNAGYLEGFVQLSKNMELAEKVFFSNPYELFTHAVKMGFENYDEYLSAFNLGFDKASTFKTALAKGYQNAKEYTAGLEGSFINADELRVAQSYHVKTRHELVLFVDLDLLKERSVYFDERVLLVMLSKLPQGKKISVNKLNQLFNEALDEYREKETRELYPWFTVQLKDQHAIVSFLKKSDEVKRYGAYDTDGEYFETKKLQDRKVVIDGSNVAHNSVGKSDSKPNARNILKMVNELKKQGFAEILIISDAALKHRLTDKEVIIEINEVAEYIESPADTQADMFIIQYVKHHHCLLISNDTFRDWKIQDPWVADNIDYYRLSFLITGDVVMLPDLEK